MRILLLPSWYPTARYPMGGIFCREQANALQSQPGVEIVVLFVDRVPLRDWTADHRQPGGWQIEEGLHVYRTLIPRVPLIWPVLYLAWVLITTYRLVHDHGFTPHLVHAHVTLPAGLAGVFIKRWLGIPLVLTEHTGPFAQLMRHPLAAWVTRIALQTANQVIAVSSALRKQIWVYPQLRRPIAVIPNVVNSKVFASFHHSHSSTTVPRLLFIGEMDSEIKGVDYLLQAIALLQERGVFLQLDLIGRGRKQAQYKALADQLGIASCCCIHDIVPHEQIVEWLAQADLLVLPSHSETFGVVLIEALAAGIPVVATACGGPEEIVTPDVGVLVAPADAVSLANAIHIVLTQQDRFPADHLHQVAEERYGQRTIAQQLIQIYHQVITQCP